MLARHFDSLVMATVALWATCVGFGWVAFPTEGKPPFVATLKVHMRWMGPSLLLIALGLMLSGRG